MGIGKSIGFLGKEFSGWNGGIDFLMMIADSVNTNGNKLFLLLQEDGSYEQFKDFIKVTFFGREVEVKEKKEKNNLNYNNIISAFKTLGNNTNIVFYKDSKSNADLINKIKKYHIDIILLTNRFFQNDISIPWIGYIPDLQHKYFPQYFSVSECDYRDKYYQNQLKYSRDLFVNANSVKEDIEKFYNLFSCNIHVLPFSPYRMCSSDRGDLSKYNLPQKYFAVCNQFWIHKDHLTAFDGLEILYKKGYQDIHIVCTGKMEDYRDKTYIPKLKDHISQLSCRNNIHFLGLIPKADQLEMINRAIALVQPTLFEGGPGGGSVVDAISKGVPCIISDIKVNKEIDGYKNVFFFKAGDSQSLAIEMEKHLYPNKLNLDEVNLQNQMAKERLSSFINSIVNQLIDNY